MTWITFALWTGGIYLTYYVALIIWDHLRSRKAPNDRETHQLSFEEYVEPIKEFAADEPERYGSAMVSSGGLRLKELFNHARAEAIEFTRPVSF